MKIHLVTSADADTERLEQALAVFSKVKVQRGVGLVLSQEDWRRIHGADLTVYAWDGAFVIGSSLWEMARRHPGLVVLLSSTSAVPSMSLGLVVAGGAWKPECHGEIFKWSGDAFAGVVQRACEVCRTLRPRLAAFSLVDTAMAQAAEWLPEGDPGRVWAGGVVGKIHALTNGANFP
jgi:hypothetical protein